MVDAGKNMEGDMRKTVMPSAMERAVDRALAQFGRAWRGFTGGADVHSGKTSVARLRSLVEECLEGKGGEVAARARATILAREYLTCSAAAKRSFLELLAGEFGIDHQAVDRSLAGLPPAGERVDGDYRGLGQQLQAPRLRLFRQLNTLDYGARFLVNLRADVIANLRESPGLGCLDRELRDLLKSWFDVGFLQLRSIDWDSPASLLEKLSDYEAVHRVRSWQDLKNRLDSDRRCFAFFHPCMEDEPLIFVEVAFVKGLADSIQRLLDPKAPVQDVEEMDTAIFFSISNTQKGLAGVSLGDFLIKRVVRTIQSTHPWMRTFATLSPVPGFSRWLERACGEGDLPLGKRQAAVLKRLSANASGGEWIMKVLKNRGWHRDPALSDSLQPILSSLCAHYLMKVKRGESQSAADPVANFHLSNGARLQRINWLADTSPKGISESAGLMVNYLYRLDKIEDFHEEYATGGVVNASSAVRALLK